MCSSADDLTGDRAEDEVTMDLRQGVDTWWTAITTGFGRGDGLELGPVQLLIILGVPLVITMTPAIWRFFGLFVTFVHELGHAFAALMTGRIVRGISLNFDHSGQMNSFGRVGFSATWAGFWGYPAPAVLGLVLITSAIYGWAPLALSLGALVLLVALIFIRNVSGVVIAVCTAVAAQLLVVFLPREASPSSSRASASRSPSVRSRTSSRSSASTRAGATSSSRMPISSVADRRCRQAAG